jgi:hypothetical protein
LYYKVVLAAFRCKIIVHLLSSPQFIQCETL